MKEKKIKTNALRILDKQKIEYEIHTYEWSEGTSSGLGVAEKLPELADRIFKTIVLKGSCTFRFKKSSKGLWRKEH